MKPAPRGFTFVEILLVLAIAGILAAIVVPAVGQYVEKSRRVQAILDLREMSTKIKQHEKSTGALPNALAEVGYDGKQDPWGKPYEFFNHRTSSGNGQSRRDKKLAPLNSDFDIYSIGRDGLTQTNLGHASSRDDLVRARDGGFIGTAEEFDP